MKTIIRKDEEAVSPVIATILMVAITVVLAAVLYVMVSGLLGPGTTTKPVITFGAVTLGSGTATFAIADTSQAVSYSNYKVNLKVNTTFGSAKALAASGTQTAMGTILGDAYTVTYQDVGGDNTVNAGDQFTVGGLQSQTTYQFLLLWSDGSQIQEKSWQTP